MRPTEQTAIAEEPPTSADPGRVDDPRPTATGRIERARLDPELAAELRGDSWQYPWDLGPGLCAPAADPLARQIAWTRETMIEPYALDGLALDDERLGLDLCCGEGRMAQRLLAWGANRVVAVSDDMAALNRAKLIRRHFAIPPSELELRPLEELGTADVPDHDVVVLAPTSGNESLIELAASHCRGVCAFECTDAEAEDVAAAALAAGFVSVERIDPPLHAVPPFLLGEREILVARARLTS
jgi:hypothetical protein